MTPLYDARYSFVLLRPKTMAKLSTQSADNWICIGRGRGQCPAVKWLPGQRAQLFWRLCYFAAPSEVFVRGYVTTKNVRCGTPAAHTETLARGDAPGSVRCGVGSW